VFGFLSEEEWEVMQAWYDETDATQSAGETNIPAISMIHGLIMGNRLRNIVQLGHYEGFSTLLIGFMLRKMGEKNAFITIDIDINVSNTTQKWIDRAGLQDYVKVITSDSSSPELPQVARDYFKGDINLVFIDSSHAYHHTVTELDLWYPHVKPLGLILLHDVSGFATNYDYTKAGGVQKALNEWKEKNKVNHFMLNGSVPSDFKGGADQLVYLDICGLGFIQKPL
jgi:predicted O-methyltransferase YrrM